MRHSFRTFSSFNFNFKFPKEHARTIGKSFFYKKYPACVLRGVFWIESLRLNDILNDEKLLLLLLREVYLRMDMASAFSETSSSPVVLSILLACSFNVRLGTTFHSFLLMVTEKKYELKLWTDSKEKSQGRAQLRKQAQGNEPLSSFLILLVFLKQKHLMKTIKY